MPIDAGGDASADASPAEETPQGEVVSEGGEQAATDTQAASGTDAPTDASLTTQQESKEAEPTEEELLAFANDPTTPQFAREKIKQTMSYAGRLKAERVAAQEEAAALKTQYEGKEILAAPDIERYKASEDRLFKLQSITATPEELIQEFKSLNERAFPQVQSTLVWDALSMPDGTPDFENLQAVVDKFAGGPGVKAQDVLSAVQALKAGTLTPDELHQFSTVEEYEAFQRVRAREKELEAKDAASDANIRFHEEQIRTNAVDKMISTFQAPVHSSIGTLKEKFKLNTVPGEPKASTDFKEDVDNRIRAILQGASTSIREIGEVDKVVAMLKKATGVGGQKASAEIEQFMASPTFQQLSAKGVSSLNSQIEGVIVKAAYQHKLMMLGLEVENSKIKSARPIIGAANQGTLPKLTEADIAKMSAADRQDHAAMALTEQLRNERYGVSRLGQ